MRVLLHSKSHIVADVPGFEREPDIEQADADLTAESAGRLCYLSGHRPNPKTATNGNYLLNIVHQRHYSVLGHSAASIYIDGISRNCTHEIIRHRWFTFSEVSQRYVSMKKDDFVTHPGLRQVSDSALGAAAESLSTAHAAYNLLVDEMVGDGYSRKEARQAARSVLPGGTETKILMSGNLRAWRDFLSQRLGPTADLEIREVALEIFKILRVEFPNSFQDFDSHGMITVERLIQRALDRYETAEFGSSLASVPRGKFALEFVEDVREILEKGLWILKEDPWEEDEIGSGI